MFPINKFRLHHYQTGLWRCLPILLPFIVLAACVPSTPEIALTLTPSVIVQTDENMPASTSVAVQEMPETTVASTPTPPLSTSTLTAEANQPIPDLSTSTPSPLPSPAEPSQILFGQPVKVGRGQIVDAAFMPDGDSLAIAVGWAGGVSLVSLDGTEHWWQPTTALLVALDASPRGDRVAAILEDGSIVIFATGSGAVQQFPASRPYVYWSDIAFAPNGEQLAFQSIGPNRGDPIYQLDLTSTELREVPRSRIDPGVRPSLVWSPDGQTLTLPGLGEVCSRTLDVNTGERLLTLRAESGCYAPWAAAYAPDGQRLAVAAPTGGIELLQPDNGTVLVHLSGDVLTQPDWTVPPLRFSPDDRWLVTPGGAGFYGDAYPTIVWDVAGGVVRAELLPAVGRQRLALAFAGEELLSLYADGRITRWPFTSAAAAETAVGQIPVIAPYLDLHWSADSRRLTAPLTFGGAAVWNAAGGELLARFDTPYTDPRLNPDGRLLALYHPENRELSIHDLDSGAAVWTVPDVDMLPDGDPFSPGGQWLAYGTGSELRLLDLSKGETAITLNEYPEDQVVTRVIWSPDGKALIAASAALDDSPGLVILWEKTMDGSFVPAHQAISVRSSYTCCVTVAAFSPSGRRVAFELLPDFEASSLAIEVYDRQQGDIIFSVKEYELNAWITDNLLLTNEGQYDTRLTRWDVVNSQKTVSTARSLGGEVYAPNGQYYADVSSSGANIGRAIKVVNWESSQAVARVSIGNDVNALRWSPDGRWLAALVSDGSLWLLPVTLPDP